MWCYFLSLLAFLFGIIFIIYFKTNQIDAHQNTPSIQNTPKKLTKKYHSKKSVKNISLDLESDPWIIRIYSKIEKFYYCSGFIINGEKKIKFI